MGLASIWFAIGALCAFIAAFLGAQVWLQIVWFAVISVATLVITRPLAKKYINNNSQPTNADRMIGKTVRITETVNNLSGSGRVECDGMSWAAKSIDGSTLPAGSTATVKDIQGVKLILSSEE